MKRVVIGSVLAIAAVLVLLGVEVAMALRSPRLPPREPYDLSLTGGAEHVVWLGDSTAAGVGASDEDHALPRLVQRQLFPDAQLTVLAVSGDEIDDVLADQLPRVADLAPTHVFISVGANDTTHLTKASTFVAQYAELLDALPSVPVTALGVPDMGAATIFAQPLRGIAGWQGERLDGRIQVTTTEHGATYVDIQAETSKAFREDPAQYLAADGFHPSDAGYALWATAVVNARK